jgi:hypothetical protein
LPSLADHGDFDAGAIPRIKAHCRTRARGRREQQVAQVPGEYLHCGIFRNLPEPKAQVGQRSEKSDCSLRYEPRRGNGWFLWHDLARSRLVGGSNQRSSSQAKYTAVQFA